MAENRPVKPTTPSKVPANAVKKPLPGKPPEAQLPKEQVLPAVKQQKKIPAGKDKEFDERKPERGLGKVTIPLDSIANIPSLTDHWEDEIEKRSKEFIIPEDKGLFSKMTRGFKKTSFTLTNECYSNVVGFLQSNELMNIAKEIELDPLNYNTHVKFISIVMKITKVLPLWIYRELFIQVCALCNQDVTDYKLMVYAIKLQNIYLTHLSNRIKENMSGFNISKSMSFDKPHNDQEELMKESISVAQKIRKMKINLITATEIQSIANAGIQKTAILMHKKTFQFSRKEIRDLGRNIKAVKEIKGVTKKLPIELEEKVKAIYRKSMDSNQMLRHILPLHSRALKIAEDLISFDEDDHTGYVLKARIYATAFRIHAIPKQNQHVSNELTKLLHKDIKETLHFYGKAMVKIPKTEYHGKNSAIIIEYVKMVIYVVRMNKTLVLGLPPEYVKDLMNSMVNMLETAESEEANVELREMSQMLKVFYASIMKKDDE